ncbi:flagellin [Phenylobacterium sp.]|uniref:flagellin n=1 Tax=Phenylobacterium sp. TaxID=1871053 RepID=UPI0035B47D64
MSVSRIATFAHTQQMITASLKVQADMAKVQDQEASGVKSSSLGGLGADAARLLRLNSQSARLTADNAAATDAQSFAQGAYSAVGDISDLATTILSQLSALNSGSSDDSELVSTYASQWLEDLQSMMNADLGGISLFSGEALDGDAVDFSDAGYDPTADPTASDTGYYQGTAKARTYTASDGSTVEISVTADDPAFEKLARALTLLKASPSDADVAQQAYDLVQESISGLGTLQEGLSARVSALQDRIDHNTAKIDILDGLSSDLNGVDLAEAAVKVTQQQTQLETLYSTISRLSSLSLLKYL